jgi:succinate dehydrogenase hydrophobic anchor subunit
MKRLTAVLVAAFTFGLLAWMVTHTERVLDACVECGE